MATNFPLLEAESQSEQKRRSLLQSTCQTLPNDNDNNSNNNNYYYYYLINNNNSNNINDNYRSSKPSV